MTYASGSLVVLCDDTHASLSCLRAFQGGLWEAWARGVPGPIRAQGNTGAVRQSGDTSCVRRHTHMRHYRERRSVLLWTQSEWPAGVGHR